MDNMDNLENFNNPDLDEFLKKIDDIESIVKGLKSEDPETIKKNLESADNYINKLKNKNDEIVCEGIQTKTGVNRTVINKYTAENDNSTHSANNDQSSFMAALEKDAHERYERKKANEKIANELKDKGNAEFAKGNYEKAIEYYTEATQKVKDIIAIYTNRAQAYIKIGKYKEAIADCDWCFRIDENCFKALIHKGRAYTYLKEFENAVLQFEKAKSIDPKQSAVIEEYIKEVERCRNTVNQENASKAFMEENNEESKNVDEIMKKVYKTDQLSMYYSGGLRLLSSILTDITQRTLFRTQHGFKITEEHPKVKECLYAQCIEKLNSEDIDLLVGLFDLLMNACKECDENMKCFMNIKDITKIVVYILSIKVNSSVVTNAIKQDLRSLKMIILVLLYDFSQIEFGRKLILDNFDTNEFSIVLLELIETTNRNYENIKLIASKIIQNLTLEKRFATKLKSDCDKFTNRLVSLYKKHKEHSIDLNSTLTAISNNLVTYEFLRNYLMEKDDYWSPLVEIFETNNNYNEYLLTIFVNLCSKPSNPLKIHADKLLKLAYNTIDIHEERPYILIGNLLQNNVNSIKQLNLNDTVMKLMQNIKTEKYAKICIKILALCTQNEAESRELVIKQDKSLGFLYKYFNDCSNLQSQTNKTFKENEILINNAVLSMTHCVDHNKIVSEALTKTNIVMDLLYLTRDMSKVEAQKNCAILLAKLAKQNDKHLERLRELKGIEIMHQSLKNVKI